VYQERSLLICGTFYGFIIRVYLVNGNSEKTLNKLITNGMLMLSSNK